MLCSETTNSADARGRRGGVKGRSPSHKHQLYQHPAEGKRYPLKGCPSSKTPSSAQVQELNGQRICKRKKRICRSYCDQYILYSAAPALSRHLKSNICLPGIILSFPSTRFAAVSGAAGPSRPGLQRPCFGMEQNTQKPLGLAMQARACSKRSFNQSEALEVQFRGRVKGTDLLLELC